MQNGAFVFKIYKIQCIYEYVYPVSINNFNLKHYKLEILLQKIVEVNLIQ